MRNVGSESVMPARYIVRRYISTPTSTDGDYGEAMTTLANRPNTALLVVDTQQGVLAGPYARDAIVANIATVVEKARRDGVTVVWVQQSNEELVKGSEPWQIAAELSPLDSEPHVDKGYADAFEETDLELVLADF